MNKFDQFLMVTFIAVVVISISANAESMIVAPVCTQVVYSPSSGLDTTNSSHELNESELEMLSESDNVRYQTKKYWFGNEYVSSRYLLFGFPFEIAADQTVQNIRLVFEWYTGCPNVEYAKMSVWDENDDQWVENEFLAPPTSPPTNDSVEELNLSYIDSPEDLSNLEIKFQGHDGYGPGWSFHDHVQVSALICNPFCGDGKVNSEEECELPNTENNSFCEQDNFQCDGNRTLTRDLFGACRVNCTCLETPWSNASCVIGNCGASCENNSDCDDLNPYTLDSCNDSCQCVHEYIPICGDDLVEAPEQCELNSTDNNTYCNQSVETCFGNKTSYRDAFGYCDGECGCVEDIWSEPVCVLDSCGAECTNDTQCGEGFCVDCICFYPDTTPPGTITNLTSTTGSDWIYWNWENPEDEDFSHVMLFINNSSIGDTSNNNFNTTNLSSETIYTLSTQTVDTNNNINTTWINHTAITLGEPDNAPPELTDLITSPVLPVTLAPADLLL
ncbi:solute carrier organic anion transporter [archaeon]|nr:solute carrier organic anion transporter [archaeon]